MPILITVGVVARNEATHIAETLRALLALDFAKDAYEIILVDGNSSDQTREIAAATLATGLVAHRVLNERDHGGRGLCFARNLVIDHASPEARYVAFTDGDCVVDSAWLRALYDAMQSAADDVAGAGGGRAIAPTSDPKELVINAFITSRVGSGWTPVLWRPPFSSKPVEWLHGIANYNAIYRKTVLQRFRYDEALVISDDNEINFRIGRAGLRFRFVPAARIYHRETNSVRQFARNMFGYGTNIANAMRKHNAMVRPFVPFSLALLGYLAVLPLLWLWLGGLALLPLVAYALLGAVAFVEVALVTRSLRALWVVALFPLEHLCYGAGVLWNVLARRVAERA